MEGSERVRGITPRLAELGAFHPRARRGSKGGSPAQWPKGHSPPRSKARAKSAAATGKAYHFLVIDGESFFAKTR